MREAGACWTERRRSAVGGTLVSGLLLSLVVVACGGDAIDATDADQSSAFEVRPAQVQERASATSVPLRVEESATGADVPSVSLEVGQENASAPDTMAFIREKMTDGQGRWPFVALDDPEFVTAQEASYMRPQDLVLGVFLNGEARAYPTDMMWFHHVANDTVGGQPIAVTY